MISKDKIWLLYITLMVIGLSVVYITTISTTYSIFPPQLPPRRNTTRHKLISLPTPPPIPTIPPRIPTKIDYGLHSCDHHLQWPTDGISDLTETSLQHTKIVGNFSAVEAGNVFTFTIHPRTQNNNPQQLGGACFEVRILNEKMLLMASVRPIAPPSTNDTTVGWVHEVKFAVDFPGDYWLEVMLVAAAGAERPKNQYISGSPIFFTAVNVTYNETDTYLKLENIQQCTKGGAMFPGRWVRLNKCAPPYCTGDLSNISPHGWIYAPYDCYYHIYRQDEIAECFHGKNTLMLGDSTTSDIQMGMTSDWGFNPKLALDHHPSTVYYDYKNSGLKKGAYYSLEPSYRQATLGLPPHKIPCENITETCEFTPKIRQTWLAGRDVLYGWEGLNSTRDPKFADWIRSEIIKMKPDTIVIYSGLHDMELPTLSGIVARINQFEFNLRYFLRQLIEHESVKNITNKMNTRFIWKGNKASGDKMIEEPHRVNDILLVLDKITKKVLAEHNEDQNHSQFEFHEYFGGNYGLHMGPYLTDGPHIGWIASWERPARNRPCELPSYFPKSIYACWDEFPMFVGNFYHHRMYNSMCNK